MTWLQAVFLGALQGITEFLPVSSSGHLVLAQHLFDFAEEKDARAIFFDGSLHLGTLAAVLFFFAREFRQQKRQPTPETSPTLPQLLSSRREAVHLCFLVALASLPAIVVSLLLSDHIKDSFTNPRMVGVSFLVLGFLLLLISWTPARSASEGTPTRSVSEGIGLQTKWWQALLIGVAQALSAVFRGMSRSGMTISAGILVGLERTWAVRFSFLMSLVASLGLGALGIFKGVRDESAASWLTADFLAMTVVATLVSAVVGFLTIQPLLSLVRRARLWWFSIYLWAVGLGTLFLVS